MSVTRVLSMQTSLKSTPSNLKSSKYIASIGNSNSLHTLFLFLDEVASEGIAYDKVESVVGKPVRVNFKSRTSLWACKSLK